MFWNAWDEGSATEVFERGSSRTKETVFALGDFLNLAGLGDGDVQVEVAWGDGAHGGDFQVVGLYGYDDVIQEGGILLFNLDEINVAGLLDEYTDLETSDVKLASLDDWADNEDWLRMVESCRGKCTGTVGFLDMLLQSKPGGMKGMGANTI